MSEDEIKNSDEVEETTDTQEVEENEVDTTQEVDLSVEEQESNESVDKQPTDESIDYKNEYERLQGELAQSNQRIAKQDKKILKLKQRSSDEEVADEPEEQDLDSLVTQEVQKQMSHFVEDTIEEEMSKVSSNEDEKKLIKWYFDNRIIKNGWSKKEITEYISDAKILANKNKIAIEHKVLSKKAKSEQSAGSPAFAGTPPKKSPQVTEYDKRMAEKYFKGDVKKWLKYKPN